MVASWGWPMATAAPWLLGRARWQLCSSSSRTAPTVSTLSRKISRSTNGTPAALRRGNRAGAVAGGLGIEPQQAAAFQFPHHDIHARAVAGETAAHVVVDTDVAVPTVEIAGERGADGVVVHLATVSAPGPDFAWGRAAPSADARSPRRRRHARLVDQALQIVGIGHQRQRQRSGQAPIIFAAPGRDRGPCRR